MSHKKRKSLWFTYYIVPFAIRVISVSLTLFQIKIRHFRQLSEEDAFDDNMLPAGLLSVLFYNVFLLFLALGVRDECQLVGALFVVKDILEIVQILRQIRIHGYSRQLK